MIDLPGYQLREIVYEGVHTVLYRGQRVADQTPVIVKLLRAEYPTARDLAKCRHEFALTRDLDLAGVVQIYALETYQHRPALIIEDFGGQALSALLATGPLDLATVLQIAIALATTLGALHACHIVHKDIKPQNIIVNLATGQVKLGDFAIASRLSRETPRLTTTQLIEGTLAYMSPEQTGRMNRTIDSRSDLYALGVTLYELLTGTLPFQSTDPLELVHAHIARLPTPPHALRPEVPPALSAIVLKLLAKAAEDRYQSAYGLRADLELCLAQLQTTGQIAGLTPGQFDVPTILSIPQTLYGREEEIAMLLAAFDRASQGQAELLLVTGVAGIGKSALVREVQQPIALQRGYFIAGKFDQYQRSSPYASLVQAFRELLRQLLTETSERIAAWQTQLRDALGPNGQVVVDVIPEVALIIGPQPPVLELGPVEAQNRFNLVFQRFIGMFTQPEHPLVIFLDDLQWADIASLRLLQTLMTDPSARHLLLIGAYREREVDAAHSLRPALAAIEQAGTPLHTIALGTLDAGHVRQLLSATLRCDAERAASLAELVYQKTTGNPFFVSQFVQTLYDAQLLTFAAQAGRWMWDLGQIRAAAITDNVVELLVGKIQQLPAQTQAALRLAACIGHQFELQILALVAERPIDALASDLWLAIQAELVLPLDADYQFVAQYDTATLAGISVAYTFAHARVQQAAYALLPESDQAAAHWRVGRVLLEHVAPEERAQRQFDLVNQLNLGRALAQTQAERDELAELNLQAGQRARAAAAFESALGYGQTGIALLGEDGWVRHYDLMLTLHTTAAEAAGQSGMLDEMERLAEMVLIRARSVLDKARVYDIRIQVYTRHGMFTAAVRAGRDILRQLGITLPQTPTPVHILGGLLQAKLVLAGKGTEALLNLPEATDPQLLATLRIMNGMMVPIYLSTPELLPLIIFRCVILSAKRGTTSFSPFIYANYALLLCGVLGDIKTGYRFGQLALRLLERFPAYKEERPRTLFWVNMFCRHWREPLAELPPALPSAIQLAQDMGNMEYAGYLAVIYLFSSYLSGRNLAEIRQEIEVYREVLSKNKQSSTMLSWFLQKILNLMGLAEDPRRLVGTVYDEAQMAPIHQAENDKTTLAYLYIDKMMLGCLFHEPAQAVDSAPLAEKNLAGIIGDIHLPIYHFYDALARLMLLPERPKAEQRRWLKRVAANQKKLKRWAHYAPANQLHRWHLIEAERARVSGRTSAALNHYDQAINLAQQHGYVNDEALAHERAAACCLAAGRTGPAARYLRAAHAAYLRWGAIAKVDDLAARYPQLLGEAAVAQSTDRAATTVHTTTDRTSSQTLDLDSVLKAAQALSSEIRLERLIAHLMQLLVESAGAQRGLLIIERDGRLTLAAERGVAGDDALTLPFVALADYHQLAETVVQYVIRTRETVILQDASQNPRFRADPYLRRYQLKSLLCLPLVYQGQFSGLLYFEHTLASGVFTPERLAVLGVLSAQAAIAIRNALLYEQLEATNRTLEQQVEQRTAELRQAKQLAESANTLKTQFLANMSHELRTPLNAIINFSDMIGLPRFGLLSERQQDLQQRVLANAEHLLGLINDILDLSKIEAGRMDLFYEEVALEPMLRGIMSSGQGLTKDKEIELTLDAPEELPCVWIDQTRIRQVMLNLLSNAAKFTEHGSITIHVHPRADGMVEIAIQDTGIGIVPEHQPMIFEEFRQIQDDHSRMYSGTGLGLPISKRLVEMHGGQMWVESTRGVGSTFFFTIPSVAAVLQPAPVSISNPPLEQLSSDLEPCVIAVVDDNTDTQEMLRQYLASAGYQVYSILDSRTALEQIEQLLPQLIILDILMPHLDGWTVLAQLRQHPAIQQIPIMMCSIVEEQRPAILIGANDYMVKPVRQNELLARVQRWTTLPATVLVIDDDPDARSIVRTMLEPHHYRVVEVSHGAEALAALPQYQPDLLVLDLMMPVMDGFTFLSQLRTDPTYATLPVLIVSARDLTAAEQGWLHKNAQEYLQKSQLTEEQFLQCVQQILTPEVPHAHHSR